jgi:hypothetical protein
VKRGARQKLDVDAMMLFALLLERFYSARPTVAAHAAILAYFTWTGHQHPEHMPAIYLVRVKKATQKFRRGARDLQPLLARPLGFVNTRTGERLFGTPQELAAAVAEFLPRK